MSSKLISLSVQVPYKSAGNAITQRPVAFDIYKYGEEYRAVPCLNNDGIRLANLPEQLVFFIEDGQPRSARGHRDGNFHIIDDIAKQLREREVIS